MPNDCHDDTQGEKGITVVLCAPSASALTLEDMDTSGDWNSHGTEEAIIHGQKAKKRRVTLTLPVGDVEWSATSSATALTSAIPDDDKRGQSQVLGDAFNPAY